MKIGIVGTGDFALGFKLCGVKNFFISNEENFLQKFEECFNAKDIGVIIAEGKYFEALPAYIKKRLEKTISPLVIPVSDEQQSSSDIRMLIKRCLGVDIWSR